MVEGYHKKRKLKIIIINLSNVFLFNEFLPPKVLLALINFKQNIQPQFVFTVHVLCTGTMRSEATKHHKNIRFRYST